jgi:predicted RNA-binding protein with PIN domain
MPYLIDGDNLLGTWPGRSRSEAEKRKLCQEINRFSSRVGRRVVIVFDGPAPPTPLPSNDATYSGAGRSADDTILDRLRAERDPAGWLVVTSDRSLGDQCRWVGARVERSDRFRARLIEPAGLDKPDGPIDVSDWMEWFGLEGER